MNKCLICGKELEVGYGMAGGGIGPYEYCEDHGIIDKWPDPEYGDVARPDEKRKD